MPKRKTRKSNCGINERIRVRIIDNTLAYLHEALANHHDNAMMKQITDKLEHNNFKNEEEFVRTLGEEQMAYLDAVVEKELSYARNAQDDARASQLRKVYELLF
ncbi:MAG TPA: sporulation protein [Lentibacillus sp.]|uniref:sporulation protein n=1 Tax=Lentibacillus sp. TaxID=1925746 RepID=UPI002B4B49E4|nr:sporulation protein [Lentibacillus sp.]HLR62065.1 sporulation protein [Lentibacillus sp.]